MQEIRLESRTLKRSVRFTDSFLHSPEKEQEILRYYESGNLRPPSLVKDGDVYLIFNGNHRVLVAIAHELTIDCIVLEDPEDVAYAQEIEGEQYRDISMVSPLSLDGLVQDLRERADKCSNQDPEDYTFRDF